MASVLAPMFISEFAPPRLRGRLVGLYQLSIVIGILAAYFSNWVLLGFARENPRAFGGEDWLHLLLVGEVWRGMFGVGVLPATAFLLLLLFVPESPRWLVKAHQAPRALAVLARIDGRAAAESEIVEIQESLCQEKGSLADLLQPGLRFALTVAVGIAVFGQFSGVTFVVYYGPEILKTFLAKEEAAFAGQVVLGIINFIFTIIALFTIDRWGRRPLLIGGMAAVTVLLAATGLFVLQGFHPLVIFTVLGLYMGCQAMSISAVIWVVIGEIFPNRLRGRASSIAAFFVWGTNVLTMYLFPWFANGFGIPVVFLTCSIFSLTATVFFWFLVPETKGKSLEEIEKYWMHRGGGAVVH
jgi:SP family arabinose:H+ symporter-like MFS transporter